MSDFIEEWLRQAGRQSHEIARHVAAGGVLLATPDAEGFAHETNHRLSIGAREHGTSFRTRPIEEIEDELVQEAPDIAAWGVLYGIRRGLAAHDSQRHLLRAGALAGLAQAEVRAAIAGRGG